MSFKVGSVPEKYHRYFGVFLALLSALFFANVYIFSKAAMNLVPFVKFGFYWFGFSLLVNTILFLSLKLWREIIGFSGKKRFILFIIGFLELVGTVMFFYSIKLMNNPSIVSFLTNTIPIFVLILSYFILKEKFIRLEYIGIFTVIIGVLLLSYKDSVSFREFFDFGTVLALISSIIFAANAILIKKNIGDIHPISIGVMRGILLWGFFFFSLLFQRGIDFSIPSKALIYILIGSMLGPVFAVLISIYALRYIEAGISSVLISTKSFITMLGAYLFFHLLPNKIQITGGILSFLGIIFISWAQHLKTKRNL